jgi:hypothetical protein
VNTVRNAEYWRAKAEEARQRASTMRDFDAKRSMLEVAANCEHLAILAGHREADDKPIRSN